MERGHESLRIDECGDLEMIRAQLPPDYREKADEYGLIKRGLPSAFGTKVTEIDSILRLLFYHVATNSSLRVTTAMSAAAGIIELSPVALHKWMKKTGPYLAELLTCMTETASLFRQERWGGYDIHVVDATTAQRPGAKGTTSRVHYAMRLTTAQPSQISVTSYRGGETFRRFKAARGQLWVADRAYSTPPGIAWLDDQQADVLVRHNRGALPLYDARGQRLDIFKKFSHMGKPGRVREWSAWVHPTKHKPIRGRLCIVRLPGDKAKEARKRVQTELGKAATDESLRAADYVVVFTTAASERLTKEQVIDLYRLRWQIELYIKRDKSIAGLDQLPNFREDTIFTWLCTKLLLAQIARRIAGPDVVYPNLLNPKPTMRPQTQTLPPQYGFVRPMHVGAAIN